MHDDANPYASPQAEESNHSKQSDRNLGREFGRWTLAVISNMPVPVLIGFGLVDLRAILGVATAHVLVIACGLLFAWVPAWFAETITRGTFVVAVSQVVPICQMIAGMIAIGITQRLGFGALGPDDDWTIGSEVAGFSAGLVAASITWALLLCLAMAIGLFLRLVLPPKAWKSHPVAITPDGPP